jgi:hypothetical protein
MSKLMMLVAAKWRDFTNINPNTEQEPECVSEESYSRKPGRSRTSKDSSKVLNTEDWSVVYDSMHSRDTGGFNVSAVMVVPPYLLIQYPWFTAARKNFRNKRFISCMYSVDTVQINPTGPPYVHHWCSHALYRVKSIL